jgi:hypothetical protein
VNDLVPSGGELQSKAMPKLLYRATAHWRHREKRSLYDGDSHRLVLKTIAEDPTDISSTRPRTSDDCLRRAKKRIRLYPDPDVP